MTIINKKLIPEIRFKDFKNSGDWKEKKIKDTLEYEQPTNYIVESNYYTSQGIPVLTANKSFILGYTDEIKGIYNNVPVIIFDDFTTDKKYVSFPFKIKSSAIKILSSKKNYNIKFIYELMTSISFNPQEHKRHYIGTYQNISILVPPLQEQQKIADFLSSVDELIELEQLKLEKLQNYFKSVSEQLLYAQIRFKKFKNLWNNYSFGDCFFHFGGTPLEKYVSLEGDYKFISIGNFSINGKYIDNGNRVLLNSKTREKILNKNNLVMVLNDKTSIGSIIGASILIDDDNKYIYNQRCERLVCKDNILPLYAWFLLNSKNMRTKLFNMSQGGTQIYVNFKSILKLQLSIPSYEEQQKIADFLSSVDELIELEQLKLERLKEYKKGLLQQLFPREMSNE